MLAVKPLPHSFAILYSHLAADAALPYKPIIAAQQPRNNGLPHPESRFINPSSTKSKVFRQQKTTHNQQAMHYGFSVMIRINPRLISSPK
jgi:hypothetical protein